MFLMILVARPVYSQDRGFEGQVLTNQGTPVFNAQIEYKHNNETIYSTTTDSIGNYRLPIGTVSVDPKNPGLPNSFTLKQPYPNPTNGMAQIEFNTKNSGNYSLQVFNIKGQKVGQKEYNLNPGHHQLRTELGIPAGIYFFRLTNGKETQVRKETVLDGNNGGIKFSNINNNGNTDLKKILEENDSLIVSTNPDNGIYTKRESQATTTPNNWETKNFTTQRILRNPTININPQTIEGSIKNELTTTINYESKEYDANLELIINGNIPFEQNNNQISVYSDTATTTELTTRITDNQNNLETTQTIPINIQSKKYNLHIKKLFGGYGNPYQGLKATVINRWNNAKTDTLTTDENGNITFEIPLNQNYTNTDKIRVWSPNGNVQDSTGQFYRMKIPINTEQQEGEYQNIMAIKDPFPLSYYEGNNQYNHNYYWNNLMELLVNLSGAANSPWWDSPRIGNPQTGRAQEKLYYITKGPPTIVNDEGDTLDWHAIIDSSLRTIQTKYDSIKGNNTEEPIQLRIGTTPQDSIDALNHGIIIRFPETGQSHTDWDYAYDLEDSLSYVIRAREWISLDWDPIQSYNVAMHEHQRVPANKGQSPDPIENAYSGTLNALKPHEWSRMFAADNYIGHFRYIENKEEFNRDW